MKINPPCMITARLMAGIRIGDGTISIGYAKRRGDECRTRYQYYIDIPSGEYSGDDIQSGNPVANHSNGLQSGLESLLSFLGASAESYQYDIRRGGDGTQGENSDLFPLAVVEWANQHSDELTMAAIELEETEDIIVE